MKRLLCMLVMLGCIGSGAAHALSPAETAELEKASQLDRQMVELSTRREYKQAIPITEQALAIRERVLGPEHAATIITLDNLGYFYKTLGQYDKALPLYQRVLTIREKVLGPEHADTATSLNKLANLYKTLGQYDKALPLYQRALAVDEKTLGPEHQDTATSLNNLANLYNTLAQYDKALPLLQRALAIYEKTLGPEHSLTANCLNNLADLYKTLGQYDKALPFMQRALAIYEKTLGPEHQDTATSLNNLANLYKTLGQYDKALPLYQRALAIYEKALGPEHSLTANCLNNLADFYYALGQYDKALPLLQRALSIREKVLGPEHAGTATSLSSLANLYQIIGQYDKALPLYQRALAIREKTLGPEHTDTAISLNNLARLYETLGQYDKALPMLQRALAIIEKIFGPEHAYTANGLNSIALLYKALGQYDKALPLLQRALAIREKVLGPEHADTAISLNDLALLYGTLGQYDKALPLMQRALAINEKTLGPDNADTATSLNNLADLYKTLSQYDKALPLMQRALAIREKVLGPEHTDTAIGLNNLARLYETLGQYDKALPMLQRALSIIEKTLGPEHADTATSLNNLADVYETLGQYDKALPLMQRALAIREKVLGPEHADTANSLNNLSLLYKTLGQYDKALPLMQRAQAIYEKALGPEHAETAASLNNLADLYKALGQYDKAETLYKIAMGVFEKTFGQEHAFTIASYDNFAFFLGDRHDPESAMAYFGLGQRHANILIEKTFPALTEQEKLAFVKRQEDGYFGILSLIHRQTAADDEEAKQIGLDWVLSRKGIVFDAQARQQEAIVNSLDPETKKLWGELAGQRAQYSKLLRNKPEKMSPEDYRARLAALQDEIARLEGQIASKSALVAEELKQRDITHKEVARALGKDAALVEFVKIADYDWGHNKWSGTWRYLAFVLKGDESVKLVDLGEAGALEKSVQSAIGAMSKLNSSAADQQKASELLDTKIWEPLAPAVGESSRGVFSPDGILNLVPFAAMQDKSGSYLVERKEITYVTTGRDLTRGDAGIKPELGLYLAANPLFDLEGVASAHAAESRGLARPQHFVMKFDQLPGTEIEARKIPGYLSGKKVVVTGKDATEESVLSAKHPKVMHLATHGFFLEDQAVSSEGARGLGRVDMTQPIALPKDYENPMVRSGLALAGANHANEAKGDRDGLLTALKVSGMDLHGTELVTLSACETGRGDVKSGEGVFGLRRAFALAGAKNLIMSLWPVSDEVTATQMQAMYREYGKGVAPAKALRLAQLDTIASLRRRGGSASPALWAPFIVQGR